MCRGLSCLLLALAVSLTGVGPANGDDVIWDFENGSDHGFTLWSVNPATPAANDPTIAGDEAVTGVGGTKGLPDAGSAWSVGRPDQFDGQKPAVSEGDKARADGTMEYNQSGKNHPFTFPVNGRGQESYLNTYNLTGWGDNLHSGTNDQIATSPPLLIGQNSQLTVWAHGGGNGTHAPGLESNPDNGYTTDSAGVAVVSAADGSLLGSVLTNGHGTLREDTIDLSAFAGQIVRVEVVDAFQGGWGWLAVDEIRVTNALELSDAAPFPKAWGPNPSDGAMNGGTWANLSWTAGAFAVSHDVYLGDSFDDVDSGTGDTFLGNQAGTSVLIGFPGFPIPGGLVAGTTYYWRIDGVNDADPNSPWKGDIWSFSIPPKTAYFPNPIDGAEFVELDATLSWTPGFGAILHTVYLGDSFENVNSATGGSQKGGASYKPPTPLEPEKVYYWRVDEFDAAATHKGQIWAFTTPGAVGNPQPANGAVDVRIVGTLGWTPADNAVSSDLYFGADADAVENATAASPEFMGSKALGSESHDPGKLALEATYYWRVDAVYPDRTVKGLLWSFTAADFLLVDDFEAYNDIEPPDPANNRIFDKWIDGFGTTTNGAVVGNDLPPYAERTIVHSGAQSMIYRYDNNLKTSEATLTLVYPRNWTEEDVTKLSVWFRGNPANSAERMFVTLNGNSVVYHDDPAATQDGGWTEWVIDLQAFAGVNLANVNTITIGLGTKNSPAAGGAGTMYFDDIRLVR